MAQVRCAALLCCCWCVFVGVGADVGVDGIVVTIVVVFVLETAPIIPTTVSSAAVSSPLSHGRNDSRTFVVTNSSISQENRKYAEKPWHGQVMLINSAGDPLSKVRSAH